MAGASASGKSWSWSTLLQPLLEAVGFVNRYLRLHEYASVIQPIFTETFSSSSLVQRMEETKEAALLTSDEIVSYNRALSCPIVCFIFKFHFYLFVFVYVGERATEGVGNGIRMHQGHPVRRSFSDKSTNGSLDHPSQHRSVDTNGWI